MPKLAQVKSQVLAHRWFKNWKDKQIHYIRRIVIHYIRRIVANHFRSFLLENIGK